MASSAVAASRRIAGNRNALPGPCSSFDCAFNASSVRRAHVKHVDVLELPLLGVALEFATADPRITDALTQVYGHWRDWEFLNAIITRPNPQPRIRLALAGSPTCSAPPYPPRIQLSGDRIRMRGTHVRGTADLLHHTGH